MRRLLILLFGLFLGSHLMAQNQDVKARYDSVQKATILTGDTIPHIELDQISVIPSPKFDSKREARKYWRLVRNLKRVLPFARVVNTTVAEMEAELNVIETDKERRKFIKAKQDSLWDKYEPELRKMTISQGRLLFKLVDRESSQTTYHWIEHYKGSFSATFWQGVARIFGSNLKSGFDPMDPNDQMIDKLVKFIDLGYI